jgi:hypothetical protein
MILLVKFNQKKLNNYKSFEVCEVFLLEKLIKQLITHGVGF